MEDRTKKLLLGGAALLGGAFWGWYIYEKHNLNRVHSITTLVEVVKEQERGYYPIFKTIAEFTREYYEQAKEKKQSLTVPVVKDMIQKQYPLIYENMRNIARDIWKKYRVSLEEGYEAMLLSFQEDPEFQELFMKYYERFDQAYMGIPPDLASDIPGFLTPEKTLEIFYRLVSDSTNNYWKKMQALGEETLLLASKGEYSFDIVGRFRVQLRFSENKRRVLAEEGLDAFEEAPERILDTAIVRYSAGNLEFVKKIQNIESMRAKIDSGLKEPAFRQLASFLDVLDEKESK